MKKIILTTIILITVGNLLYSQQVGVKAPGSPSSVRIMHNEFNTFAHTHNMLNHGI